MDIIINLPDTDYSAILTKIMLACPGCKVIELPSEDCISRAEAIKALNCEISGSIKSDIDLSKYKREFQEFANIILKAEEKAIQNLPPITPKTDFEHKSCEDYIEIPKETTNGDMIKALFPNLNFKEMKDFFERRIVNGGGIRCYVDWWNSPYRYGG